MSDPKWPSSLQTLRDAIVASTVPALQNYLPTIDDFLAEPERWAEHLPYLLKMCSSIKENGGEHIAATVLDAVCRGADGALQEQIAERRRRAEEEAKRRREEEDARLAKEATRRHYSFRELVVGRNWGKTVFPDYVPKNDELMVGLLDSIERLAKDTNSLLASILTHLKDQTPEARRATREYHKRLALEARALEICEQRYRVDSVRDSRLLSEALATIIFRHKACDGRDPESLPYDDMFRALKLSKKRRERMDALLARVADDPPANGSLNGLRSRP